MRARVEKVDVLGCKKSLAIFFSSPSPRCLVSGQRLGVFSVPDIYVETYVYDDMYVRLLMTSYFHMSERFVR